MRGITLSLFFLFLHNVLTFTLPGKWKLTSLGPSNLSMSASIKQIVLKQTQIVNELTIISCNRMKYQFNIDQSNIWIDFSSQIIDSSNYCTDEDGLLQQNIRKALRKVFTFQILSMQLVLYDASSNPLLQFTREVKEKDIVSLKGTWISNFKIDDGSTYTIIADDSTINVCNTVVKYLIKSPYSITFQLQSSSSCENKDIVPSILQASFFRKHNGLLQFYNNKMSLLVEARYRSDQSSIPQASSAAPAIATSFGAGNYTLLLLYRRDLMRVKVQITNQSIKMTLCTQLIFTYTLSQSNQITITGTNTPNPNCNKVNETIYYNYLTSATSYSIDADGVITLQDNSNKGIISLAQ